MLKHSKIGWMSAVADRSADSHRGVPSLVADNRPSQRSSDRQLSPFRDDRHCVSAAHSGVQFEV
jgi:hypothetical protein